MPLTRAIESMSVRQAREGLTNYLLPSSDGGWRDIYRSGWLPSWFNQQWGGAQWGTEMQDAATGVTYKFDVATGNVQDDSGAGAFSQSASNYYTAQSFKVAESFTLDAVWVKLYKVQGAVATNYNITARIYSDNAGSPNVALGSATTISTRQLTNKTDGDWYRLSGLNCALTAGTTYHIVLSTLTAVDGTTYPSVKLTLSDKYPHGNTNTGTSVPAWTPNTNYSMCFLVETPAASGFLQSSGLFDKKLVFNEATLLDQSKSLAQPMRNFFDGSQFTYLIRGASFTKGKPICDFVYGLDHDRISLTTHGTSGVGILTVYTKNGTVIPVSGTVDLSTASNKDIAIVVRSKGDTADYAKLYVNGAVDGSPATGQAISFDPLFRELGTAWLGGGFAVAPAWTTGSLSSFGVLPSSSGWTWTGTATEANAMSVANSKLYQNKGGYASADTGYYLKASAGLNNTTGWTVTWKGRVAASTNTSGSGIVTIRVEDGAKREDITIHEYFVQALSNTGGTVDFTIQGDFRSQEHTFTFCGKGSDYFLFIDNKLAIDGTGKLATASASNQIIFGDQTSIAGENADVIWSYVKYYTGGALIPQASTGASISETAYWSGDKSAALKDLYNYGAQVSAKTYMGFEKNYVGEGVVQREDRQGVLAGSTTSAYPGVLVPDFEAFYLGSLMVVSGRVIGSSGSVGAGGVLVVSADGALDSVIHSYGLSIAGTNNTTLPISYSKQNWLGLHKFQVNYHATSGTFTLSTLNRALRLEAKS